MNQSNKQPNRGEIWFAELDPIIGHEEAKKRPCLVISSNHFNHSDAELVIVMPLTSKQKDIKMHIPLYPPEGGIFEPSYVMCEQIRSISLERLDHKPLGKINAETLNSVSHILKYLLNY